MKFTCAVLTCLMMVATMQPCFALESRANAAVLQLILAGFGGSIAKRSTQQAPVKVAMKKSQEKPRAQKVVVQNGVKKFARPS